MPRRKREYADGGIYHVFNRGNDKRALFLDEEDFVFFLGSLLKGKEKYEAEMYHYCLMTNHYHLLFKVKWGEHLSSLMHWVQLGYVRYAKKRYGNIGHLFQERFRSPLIDSESYYLECGRYIERNPVKAYMVKNASDYRWSSASYYVLGKPDKLISENPYYKGMGWSDIERRESYRDFLLMESPYSDMVEDVLNRV